MESIREIEDLVFIFKGLEVGWGVGEREDGDAKLYEEISI